MSLRVFISYGHEDLKTATVLRDGLQSRGMHAFLAQRDIAPGKSILKTIKKEMRKSDLMILLWSRDSSSSSYVGSEIGWAEDYEKTIIPIMLAPGLPKLPIVGDVRYLKAWDTADMTDLIADLEKRKAKKALNDLLLVAGVAVLALMIIQSYVNSKAEQLDPGGDSPPGDTS